MLSVRGPRPRAAVCPSAALCRTRSSLTTGVHYDPRSSWLVADRGLLGGGPPRGRPRRSGAGRGRPGPGHVRPGRADRGGHRDHRGVARGRQHRRGRSLYPVRAGGPRARAGVGRGVRALSGQGRGRDPLYIVDGMIVNGGLPDINPEDIDNVEVVKGAAAASLYGSRAANGVINITTRSGRRALEGVTFHFRNEVGTNDIERDFGLAQYTALVMDESNQQFCAAVTGQPLCAQTFNYYYWQFRINNDPGFFALSPPNFPIDPGSTITQSNTFATGNVLKERFQISAWPGPTYNAVRQTITDQLYSDNSLDMTGRVGSTQFYASGSNLTQQGAIRFLQGFQ